VVGEGREAVEGGGEMEEVSMNERSWEIVKLGERVEEGS